MTVWLFSLFFSVLLFSLLLTRFLCSENACAYLLDRPNERSLHNAPIPRTGGLAILSSFIAGLGLFWLLCYVTEVSSDFQLCSVAGQGKMSVWVVGILVGLAVVSFLDDRTGLPPGFRFAIHCLAASGLLWGTGWTLTTISVPTIGEISLGWLAAPFTVLSIVWMTNLYNFMDGMDGFASGMTIVGFACLSYLAWAGGHIPMALLSLVVAAACAGFMPFNFPPARIFMGDVGSVPLGFLAGTSAVWGVHNRLFDLWVPLLLFSPFVVDASVTLLRRLFSGETIWCAHREHYYQRLVLAGWGHKKALLVELILMLACAVSVMTYVRVGDGTKLGLLGVWAVIYLGLALGVHTLERRHLKQVWATR